MARYVGPDCRLCRRAGQKLFLKGEKCFMPKCAVERRHSPPGQIAQRRRRVSDRGLQLREKQKAKVMYGVLERQFRGYFEKARKTPLSTGEVLVQLLERRLDNVVFRLDFAESRDQARQLVRHGHIMVSGKKVSIPSYLVKPGDVVGWKQSSQEKEFAKAVAAQIPRKAIPGCVSLEDSTMMGRVVDLPAMAALEGLVETRMIIEFYSK